MVNKYFGGTLPQPCAADELDRPFIDQFPAKLALIDKQMNDLAFNKALLSIWELISSANKYIDDSAPWALAKDDAQKDRLGTVMYNLLEAIRLIGLLVAPFMPDTGARIMEILAQDSNNLQLDDQDQWGGLSAGITIEKAAPMFPRIEES